MNRIRPWHLCGVLVVLSLVAYSPLRENGFIDYDDENFITKNPHLVEGSTWSEICWAWTNGEAPYWMPLTWLTLELDGWLSPTPPGDPPGLSPVVVHSQNLFWHTGAALLLFGLFRRLTGSLWRSFLVAALFDVHPMHVESVAWAIERKDVLMAFFGLVTLHAYLSYVQRPGWVPYLAMSAAFLASLLAKPMLITLPLLLLVLDFWPLCRLQWPATPRGGPATAEHVRVPLKQLIYEKIPIFAIAFMCAIPAMEHRMAPTYVTIPLSARVMNAFSGYGWYLSATFYPSELGILYPHPQREWSWARALAGAGTLAAVTALAIWQRHGQPWLLAGWVWFVLTLAPVIGLSQSGAQAWADRFSYWPHIGLFVAVVWGLGGLVGSARLPRWICGCLCVLVLGWLVVLTQAQVAYWKDSITVWEHALAVTTRNDFAHQRLSICYRRVGRDADAEHHLHEALRIQRERNRLPTLEGATGRARSEPNP
jgi:hypothetical protein